MAEVRATLLAHRTRMLCYRKDDRAMSPTYGCRENFQDADYANDYFSRNFSRAFVPNSECVGLVCAVCFQDFQPVWSQSTNVTRAGPSFLAGYTVNTYSKPPLYDASKCGNVTSSVTKRHSALFNGRWLMQQQQKTSALGKPDVDLFIARTDTRHDLPPTNQPASQSDIDGHTDTRTTCKTRALHYSTSRGKNDTPWAVQIWYTG